MTSEKDVVTEERRNSTIVQARDVDVAAMVMDDNFENDLTPEISEKLRRKIDLHMMPLMCFSFVLMIADQVVVAQSAILGIFEGASLTQNQFNWLATVLYITIMVFEYPQNLALQRYPVAKWMSVNIFIWSIALLAHAACKSFGALVACRIVMGMCESVILPGFMIVTSMFYTRSEHTHRVGLWYMAGMCGSSFLGFIAAALLYVPESSPLMPWQWMMIIMGVVTFLFAIVFVVFFPDSPTTARFLTKEERVWAVQRIRVNQTGVENKRWKKEQSMETIWDLKVWIMAGFGFVSHVPISMSFQKQIIVSQLGFSPLSTTLLSCADGAITIIGILIGLWIASRPYIGRGYATVITSVPPFLGAVLINVLPPNNKIVSLFMYWLSYWVMVPYTIFLGWIGSLVAGHTKRITTNTIVLISAYLGTAVGPFMWRKEYQPRNRIPWLIIALCVIVGALMLLALRIMLYFENKRRDNQPRDTSYDEMYMKKEEEDGTIIKQRVDKAFLDLTDKQNKDFRYLL
ncbi:membrane transporter [Coprinopsis marcescibilis]|uniref:Membrane transporter n=1 Tax=Coprinopsis marcescibilis TaxID=230819 RepID=A0A5C3L1L4_COPMA|nr:membrane transporter [Coprinopsis marcescibilis]